MTDYEALELRQYYRAENAAAFRYWVSLTFAVLVAAYVAGDHLNWLTVSVILTLYVLVSYSNQRILQTIGDDLEALTKQIELMIANNEEESPALQIAAEGMRGLGSFLAVAYTLRAILFIGTIIYVLSQAGYIG